MKALDTYKIPVLPGGRTGLFNHPDALLFGRTLTFLADTEWSDEQYGARQKVTIEQLSLAYSQQFELAGRRRNLVRQAVLDWYARARDDVPADLVGDYHKLLNLCGVGEWDMNDSAIAARAGVLARCTAPLRPANRQ